MKSRPEISSPATTQDGYLERSKRPLEILLFLLPFIVFYEYELTRVLRVDGGVITNAAHLGLLKFLSTFGWGEMALSLPALLLVLCLLVWHTLLWSDWKVDLSIVARMWAESAALAVPVLLLATGISACFTPAASSPAIAAASVEGWDALSLPARIAVSIGAGLYEELLFRMMLILAVHALLKDALAVSQRWATIVAVTASACMFAIYHPMDGASSGMPIESARTARFVFLLCAGFFWAILFLWRGFGIAAGSHMLYDVAVSVLANDD
ncbi:MAG: CPBP family intramembrane metalloprotease [Phycisphaerales bacterium]|nr:CPBP family intramembrane metalloprotease [Phycisphaerales bacterium]